MLSETEESNRKKRVFRSQMLRQMALGGKEGVDLKLLRERAKQLGEAVDAVTTTDAKSDGIGIYASIVQYHYKQ